MAYSTLIDRLPYGSDTGVVPDAYVAVVPTATNTQGFTFEVKIGALRTNLGPSTLDIGFGVKPILDSQLQPLVPGIMKAGSILIFSYDVAGNHYQIIGENEDNAGHIIEYNSVPLPQQPVLDFTGNVNVFDGPGGRTTVNIPLPPSPVINQNKIYVDAVYGNNFTGQKYDIGKPFQTIKAAQNVALVGEVVYVLPGTYNLIGPAATLGKEGITYYFEDGAIIVGVNTDIFQAGNFNIMNVQGYGDFRAIYRVLWSSSSNVNFQAKSMLSIGEGSVEIINVQGFDPLPITREVNIQVLENISTDNTPLAEKGYITCMGNARLNINVGGDIISPNVDPGFSGIAVINAFGGSIHCTCRSIINYRNAPVLELGRFNSPYYGENYLKFFGAINDQFVSGTPDPFIDGGVVCSNRGANSYRFDMEIHGNIVSKRGVLSYIQCYDPVPATNPAKVDFYGDILGGTHKIWGPSYVNVTYHGDVIKNVNFNNPVIDIGPNGGASITEIRRRVFNTDPGLGSAHGIQKAENGFIRLVPGSIIRITDTTSYSIAMPFPAVPQVNTVVPYLLYTNVTPDATSIASYPAGAFGTVVIDPDVY